MARAPTTALHARLSQIGQDVTAAFAPNSPVVLSVAALKADTTRQDAIERRVVALEQAVSILARRQHYWMSRLMMYGVDAANGAFLPSSPLALLLIDASYPDVQAIAKATGGRGQKPWQKIHDDLNAVYKSDPKKYVPPPEPAELETFYEICVATK